MKKQLTVLIILFGMFQLSATDGYLSLGYGAYHKGLAGAGLGLHYTCLVNGNPASNVFLGKEFSVGIALFSPSRQYTIEGNPSGMPGTFGLTPGTVESDSKMFLIPHIAANFPINEKSAFGVSLFGNGGMNTNYPTQTFYDQSIETTGVNLVQMFVGLTYSYKLHENHSVGLTAVLAGQQFEAKGLSSFAPFSSDAANLTNNDASTSVGFGFKVGYHGKLSEQFAFAAVYQSKAKMGEFEEYAGLFAEQGGFDIPSYWTAGIVYSPSTSFRVALDVKSIQYSGVASIANPIDAMALPPAFLNPGGDPNNPMDYTPNPNHVPLGSDEGSGFGWEDMMVFKIGMEYDLNESTTLRGGFSQGEQPIPESEVMFNILAPGVISSHIALGMSKDIGTKGQAIHVSFNYALNNKVEGVNPFDFDPVQAQQGNFVPNQNIILEMNQFDLAVQYTF
ncbi:MAG: hypothetical protein HKO89_01300 [Saprospiraceae bacterium]|nr:hypothetical protein [Saprospiraceae bacterium]